MAELKKGVSGFQDEFRNATREAERSVAYSAPAASPARKPSAEPARPTSAAETAGGSEDFTGPAVRTRLNTPPADLPMHTALTSSFAVSLPDVLDAATAIAPHVQRTPLVSADHFPKSVAAKLWLKCENLQHGSAFKARRRHQRRSESR
jgi:hypothetical protein